MHLTRFVMAIRGKSYFMERNVKRVPGNLFDGKHRLSEVVTNKMKKGLLRHVRAEQANIQVLSRPYVTKEEDPRVITLPPDPEPLWIQRKKLRRIRLSGQDGKMIPHTHAHQFYSHILNDRKWE